MLNGLGMIRDECSQTDYSATRNTLGLAVFTSYATFFNPFMFPVVFIITSLNFRRGLGKVQANKASRRFRGRLCFETYQSKSTISLLVNPLRALKVKMQRPSYVLSSQPAISAILTS